MGTVRPRLPKLSRILVTGFRASLPRSKSIWERDREGSLGG